jgi:hypothetical protein
MRRKNLVDNFKKAPEANEKIACGMAKNIPSSKVYAA